MRNSEAASTYYIERLSTCPQIWLSARIAPIAHRGICIMLTPNTISDRLPKAADKDIFLGLLQKESLYNN